MVLMGRSGKQYDEYSAFNSVVHVPVYTLYIQTISLPSLYIVEISVYQKHSSRLASIDAWLAYRTLWIWSWHHINQPHLPLHDLAPFPNSQPQPRPLNSLEPQFCKPSPDPRIYSTANAAKSKHNVNPQGRRRASPRSHFQLRPIRWREQGSYFLWNSCQL